MAIDQYTFDDPTTRYPSITPSSGEDQPEPGLDADLGPQADLGENTYRGTGRLDGRRAIVTGGDSGIGAATAIAFAREGADVLISYLPEEEEDAQRIAGLIRDAGRTAVTAPGDLTDKAYCEEIVARAVEEFGGLDILVNNAGKQIEQESLEDIDDDQLIDTYETNILAMFPEFGKDTPLGRAGQPAELAPAYVFLASAESSYVVGETLNVNGGSPTP